MDQLLYIVTLTDIAKNKQKLTSSVLRVFFSMLESTERAGHFNVELAFNEIDWVKSGCPLRIYQTSSAEDLESLLLKLAFMRIPFERTVDENDIISLVSIGPIEEELDVLKKFRIVK